MPRDRTGRDRAGQGGTHSIDQGPAYQVICLYIKSILYPGTIPGRAAAKRLQGQRLGDMEADMERDEREWTTQETETRKTNKKERNTKEKERERNNEESGQQAMEET